MVKAMTIQPTDTRTFNQFDSVEFDKVRAVGKARRADRRLPTDAAAAVRQARPVSGVVPDVTARAPRSAVGRALGALGGAAGRAPAHVQAAGEGVANADRAVSTVVTYLVIYAAMNLGAFAVIISVARKTGSAEIETYNGLFRYAPHMAIPMTMFLISLGGLPPFGGFWAKLFVFRALTGAETGLGYTLAVVGAVNAVIAFGYYIRIARAMWVESPHLGDETPIKVPASLGAALAITGVLTVLFGVLPGVVTHFTDVSLLAGG